MNPPEIQKQIDQIIQQLLRLRENVEESVPSLPPEAIEKLNNRICLNCGEPIPKDVSPIRGCHSSCRKSIRRQIEKGELTDDQAIRRGMWAPPNVSGRPPRQDTKIGKFVAEREAKYISEAQKEIDEITRKAVSKSRKVSNRRVKKKRPPADE